MADPFCDRPGSEDDSTDLCGCKGKYRITSKQYVEGGLQLRVISEIQPELECMSIPATLEDAYIYVTNQYE